MLTTKGQLGQRIFQPILAFIILGVSDLLAISLLTFLPGVTFDMMTQPTIYRLEGMVATKTLFISVIFLLSVRKTKGQLSISYWALFCSVPIISSIILGALIRYESYLNITGSYGLLAASSGIFIMNFVMMVLLERLSANTERLLKQEMALQQVALQKKYFDEIQVANDNLRGFRHDINNHFQVLIGYMETSKFSKAKDYLQEIGSFIQENESIVNTGHPLIDAVVGVKLTHAKKRGIDVDFSLNMKEDLQMTQMDLCSVLGNILDNAIEACDRIVDAQADKYILFTIDEYKGYLRIVLKNSAVPADDKPRSIFVTSKKEEGHGIGLSNVKRVINKYRGNIYMNYEDAEFYTMIMIPTSAKS